MPGVRVVRSSVHREPGANRDSAATPVIPAPRNHQRWTDRVVTPAQVLHAVRRVARIAGLGALLACGGAPPDTGYYTNPEDLERLNDQALKPVALAGVRITASPSIGRPSQIGVVGNKLWLSDRSGDPYLHLIDLTSRTIVRSLGQGGEGPGDFHGITRFSVRGDAASTIWASDPGLRRMTVLTELPTPPELFTLPTGVTPLDLVWLTNDVVLGIGDFDTNRVILANAKTHQVRIVPGELLGADSISIGPRRDLSTGFLVCPSADAGRFGMAFVGAGRIDIHDTSGRLIARARVPFPSNGEFTRDDTGRWHARYTWRYYADCVGTKRYLYALFAGHRTDARPGDGTIVSARDVHVFSWQGELLQVFRLDHMASAIAIAGDTVLYAAGEEGDGIFSYRFRVP